MGLLHFSFMSKTLGYHTNVYLILPADNFSADPNRTYTEVYSKMEPFQTLYLLHGGGGNALDWIRFTSIERYAQEHHIAVVMPEVLGDSFYTDMAHGYDCFTYITEELPVVMENNFPLSAKKEDRFVAGLSMGGYGAIKWAFRKPEFFAAAAGLSGVSLVTDLFSARGFAPSSEAEENSIVNNCFGGLDKLDGSPDDTKYLIDLAVEKNVKLPALYVCIGTEDPTYRFTKDYMAYAREKGLEITYEEGPGKHDWQFWDVYIQRVLDWLPLKK
ncbi:MAG TPA: alpha/beta hydrolase family protein [Clostridia bacterium]|nr:alpha/beta hydrolase family protein [Clostridia bacterium]